MTATLCSTIDTLAMVYLDDELADEERREVELHLHDCPSCAERLSAERKIRGALRAALAPPPAPALLRARIVRGLDQIDRTESRATWKRLLLPTGAMTAAAAAMVMFVAWPQHAERTATNSGLAGREVVKVQSSKEPLSVAGPTMSQPEFQVPGRTGAELRGARLLEMMRVEAAHLPYVVTHANGYKSILNAFIIKNIDEDDLAVGVPVEVGGKLLYATTMDGPNGTFSVVSYTDLRTNRGYIFTSDQLEANTLIDIVVREDLVSRSNEVR
jgi:mycothiol system anti-sigma-R factor